MTISSTNPEKALCAILAVPRPYLNDVVIVGGWVPHLYRQYGTFPDWQSELSLTQELDVLITRELPAGDRPSLPDLLTEAGFTPQGNGTKCAVWATSPERGGKIEFLVHHQGTRHELNVPVAVRGQQGSDSANLGAIVLDALDIMHVHTTTLSVPIGRTGQEPVVVTVRVPTLSAYCLNKAVTFPHRQPSAFGEDNPKRSKDLLYLRDLAAAGPTVLTEIQQGCKTIQESSRRGQFLLSRAVSNLENALHPTEQRWIVQAATMRVEREHSLSQSAAEGELIGRLTDLTELLRALDQ